MDHFRLFFWTGLRRKVGKYASALIQKNQIPRLQDCIFQIVLDLE
jgi:hypothetical protein